MLINESQLSSLYASAPVLKGKLQTPITIDIEPFTVEEKTAQSIPSTYQGDKNRVFNDEQQVQFVRVFSTRSTASIDTNNQITPSSLLSSKGIQHYLQIDKISNLSTQKIVDETV